MRASQWLSLLFLATLLCGLVVNAYEPPIDDYNAAEQAAEADAEYDPDQFKSPYKPNSNNPNNMFYNKFGLNVDDENQTFILEGFLLALLVVYVVNFFVGKNKNNTIAAHWFNSIRTALDEQFHDVGAYDPPSSETLIKDSHNLFKVYASGRRNCTGILATLELKKRQDLFSLVLAHFNMSTLFDYMTLEIPLDESVSEPLLFAICKRKDERKVKRANKDIEALAVTSKSDLLSKDLVILQDSAELEKEILTEQLAKVVQELSDLILSIHITDYYVNMPSISPKVIRCQFLVNAGSPADLDNLGRLTTLACLLVDQAAKVRLSGGSKKTALKKREVFKEQLLKSTEEERKERLKEERRRKEEEELANLTPAELKKREEKELRKSLKKRNNAKVKVLR